MPLDVFTLASVGGLQDSLADPATEAYLQASNVLIHRGRLGIRAGITALATAKDSGGGNVDAVVGICLHNNKLYMAGYDATLDEVNLIEVALDGTGLTHKAVIWSSVTTQPTAVIMKSFTAGTAVENQDRIYIADFDQNFNTVYWNGTSIANIQADLGVNSYTVPDARLQVTFNTLAVYQWHLWGSGYDSYDSGTTSHIVPAEIVRFSTPGAIPLTDIAGGTNPRAWHSADYVNIGRRGNPIMAMEVVAGRLVIFQQDQTHAINGYDRNSWSVRNLSPNLGAVGPRAVGSYDGKLAFFWTENGPAMTDGDQVIDISEPIRKRVDALEASTKVTCMVDPVQATAFFMTPTEGSTYPNHYLAFDINAQRWTEGDFYDASGNRVQVGAGLSAVALGSAAVGPSAAPSGVTLSVHPDLTNTYDDTWDDNLLVTWTNGDNTVTNTTEIYRDTNSGFTPGPSFLIATVGSGTASYWDQGLSPSTTYYYKLRHYKNSQGSSYSTQASGKTRVIAPTVQAIGWLTGIRVQITNNEASAARDIKLFRVEENDYKGTEIATIQDVAAGATYNYTDTAGVDNVTYWYYCVAVDDTGTYSMSAWSNLSGAIYRELAAEITYRDFIITFYENKPSIKYLAINWDVVRGSIHDYVHVYKDIGSGWVKMAEVPLTNLTYRETFTCPYTLTWPKYELRVYDSNITLTDTETVNSGQRISPCIDY